MAAFAITALAAEVTATWKATAEGPNGTIERTFVFRVAGNKLTGETTSSILGKSAIMDGKIDGDNLSFTMKFQDKEMKLNYKGKVSGNEIKFTVENPSGGPTLE